jgi:hypothetical protein
LRWTTELLGWMRAALVRWVLATAEVASIAVTANAVIRVFMTILLGNLAGVMASVALQANKDKREV